MPEAARAAELTNAAKAAGSAGSARAAGEWDDDVNMDGPVYPSPSERAAAAAQRGAEAKYRAAMGNFGETHGLSEADAWHSL